MSNKVALVHNPTGRSRFWLWKAKGGRLEAQAKMPQPVERLGQADDWNYQVSFIPLATLHFSSEIFSTLVLRETAFRNGSRGT